MAKNGVAAPVRRVRDAFERVRVFSDVSGPSLTKQSFKDECDINVIMRRYEQTGVMPFAAERAAQARYIDCSELDYQKAMIMVASTRSAFNEMPSRIRDRFGNDPARLMEFLENPANRPEAIELGLLRSDAVAGTPLAVPAVEPGRSDPNRSLSRVESGDTRTVETSGPKS